MIKARASTIGTLLLLSVCACFETSGSATQTPGDTSSGGGSQAVAPLDLPPDAGELDAAEQEMSADISEQLSYYTGSVQDTCGLPSEVNWASFNAADKLTGLPSTIASACQGLLHAAGEFCADAGQRDKLTAKIDSIECQHVPERGQSGLFVDGRKILIRVVVEQTGEGGVPAEYFAPNRDDGLTFLERL